MNNDSGTAKQIVPEEIVVKRPTGPTLSTDAIIEAKRRHDAYVLQQASQASTVNPMRIPNGPSSSKTLSKPKKRGRISKKVKENKDLNLSSDEEAVKPIVKKRRTKASTKVDVAPTNIVIKP